MRKLVLILVCIPCVIFSQNEISEKKLDSILLSYTNANKPGLAGGVIQNGTVLYLKGFGVEDVETLAPITIKTKFQVDDLAKQFTVFGIFILEKEGKLSLEDDIRKHLPNFPEYRYVVKIKHLLNHTSGLYNLDPLKELLSIEASDIFTHEDAIRIISSQKKLSFQPGTNFSYHRSDTEIILLTEIIKSASGMSFVEFAKKKMFEPLGMTNTLFDRNNSMLSHHAKSYTVAEEITYNPLTDYTLGVTNLYTTVEDLAKWFQLYSVNGEVSQLVKKLDAYARLDSGKEYAATWGKMTLGRYYDHPERGLQKMSWQFGLVGGYGANFFRFQSHDVIGFVLGNNNRYNGMPAMLLANQIVESAYTEPSEIAFDQIKFTSLSSKKLKKFEGIYWNKTNGLVRKIRFRNDTLRYMRLGSDRETSLLPRTKNKFQFFVNGDTESFVTFDDNGYQFSSLNSLPENFHKIEPIESADVNMEEYAGVFYNRELDLIYRFSIEDESLVATNFNSPKTQFFPIVKDNFRSNTFMLSGIKFLREENKVSGFEIHTDGINGLYFQKML